MTFNRIFFKHHFILDLCMVHVTCFTVNCAINKLSINFSKTSYILVSSSRISGSINVNNIKIKSQIRYVYINQHLHWGPQIKHIHNKLAKNKGDYSTGA